MDMNLLQKYIPILQFYDLEPKYIEEFGKVIKVYTDNGVFALKKIEEVNGQRNGLLRVMHTLNDNGFKGMMPLYYTNDGRFLVYEKEQGFYLMPWLNQSENSDENNRFFTMFTTLGRLHRETKKEIEVEEEELEKEYDSISSKWEEDREMLENFMENCEQKWYMSPFELYFCSYYHQTIRSHEFAVKIFDEWYELMQKKDSTRLVVVHGNLSSQHFLVDKQSNGYFISLERAHEASPIYDLVQFYNRSLFQYPVVRGDRYEWFVEYEKTFPLEKDEKKLMLSYLAYPQHMVSLVKKYRSDERNRSEWRQTSKLQKVSWLMNNLEQFVGRVQQEIQTQEMLEND